MYVFYARDFCREVRQLRLQELVRKQSQSLLKVQGDKEPLGWTKLKPTPWYCHELTPETVAIGTVQGSGPARVWCWLWLFRRDDPDGKSFLDEPPRHEAPLKARLERERLKLRALSEGPERESPLEPPPLPLTMQRWLALPPLYGNQQSTVFYETGSWYADIESLGAHDDWRLTHVYALLKGLIETGTPSDDAHLEAVLPGARRLKTRDVSVLLVQLSHGGSHHFLLVRLFVPPSSTAQPTEEELRALEELKPILESFYHPPASERQEDILAKLSRRCYPELLVYDEALWQRFMRDRSEEANLALSAEELSILQGRIPGGSGEGLKLPLFIEGQAGSGKSLMLAYLFAAYCRQAIQADLLSGDQPSPLLFVTLNEQLLEQTRQRVLNLLKAEAEHITRYEASKFEDVQLKGSFVSFRELVRSLLPRGQSAERTEGFPEAQRITFERFKRWYLATSSDDGIPLLTDGRAKKIPPEQAWMVIRAYIKGYSLEGYLTPERYESINRRDRLVEADLYKTVYESVWNHWYRRICEKHHVWDELDLVRRVLESNEELPCHPVIFCDECQDFTRLELRLLLRLSPLERYGLPERLADGKMPQLPLLFAGDPLQSLHPSGFKWEALESQLYEELKRLVDSSKLDPHPMRVRLTYNYRSQKEIVGLLNRIQWERARLLKLKELSPQRVWQAYGGMKPSLYVLNKNIRAEELQGLLTDTTLIVPTDEGGELNFVEDDELLKTELKLEKGTYRNVHTALSAKGLEFRRVVLYKFGQALASQELRQPGASDSDNAQLKWFFNKLYVAASRARQILLILDTQEGAQYFWETLRTPSEQLDPTALESEAGTWLKSSEAPIMGDRNGIREFREERPREIAEGLEREGKQTKTAELLLKAAGYYARLNIPKKEKECEAYADWYAQKYESAGRRFEALDRYALASDVYWEGQLWRPLAELLELDEALSRGENAPRKFIAQFMLLQEDWERQRSEGGREASSWCTEQALVELERELSAFLAGQSRIPSRSSQWTGFISRLLMGLQAPNTAGISAKTRLELARTFMELPSRGLIDAYEVSAVCFFQAGDWKNAAEQWKISGNTQHRRYYEARAQQTSGVEAMRWWDKAEQWDQVLMLYVRERPSSEEAQHLASRAYEKKGQLQKAYELCLKLAAYDRAWNLLQQGQRSLPNVWITEQRSLLLRRVLEAEQWKVALELVGAGALGAKSTVDEVPSLLRWRIAGALLHHRPRSFPDQVPQRLVPLLEPLLKDDALIPPDLTLLEYGALFELLLPNVQRAEAYYERCLKTPARPVTSLIEWVELRRRWLYCQRELTESIDEQTRLKNRLQPTVDGWVDALEQFQREGKRSQELSQLKAELEPRPGLTLKKHFEELFGSVQVGTKPSPATPEQKPSPATPEQKPSPATPEQKPSPATPEQRPSELTRQELRRFFELTELRHRPPVQVSWVRIFGWHRLVPQESAPPIHSSVVVARQSGSAVEAVDHAPETLETDLPFEVGESSLDHSAAPAHLGPAASISQEAQSSSFAQTQAPEPVSAPPTFTEQDMAAMQLDQVVSLRLRNFRGFQDVVLPLDDLTVLIGRNGAGKSSLRLALDLLRELMGESLETVLERQEGLPQLLHSSRKPPAEELSIALRFRLKLGTHRIEGLYGFTLKSVEDSAAVIEEVLTFSHDVPGFHRRGSYVETPLPSIKPTVERGGLALVLVGNAHPLWSLTVSILRELRTHWIQPQQLREDIKSGDARALDFDGRNAANVLKGLDHDPKARAWLVDYLKLMIPGLEDIRATTRQGRRGLKFLFQTFDGGIERSSMSVSDGTLRTLGCLLAVCQRPDELRQAPSLVFLEEIENSIHPWALSALVEALTSPPYPCQVVFTSHNPELLSNEAIQEGQVRYVQQERSVATLHRLSPPSPDYQGPSYSVGEMLRSHSLRPAQRACFTPANFFGLEDQDV